MLIGLSGKKRHGKGTCAEILVREYGFVQVDFADALRGDMAVLNPFVGTWGQINDWEECPIRYNEAIEHYGYERAKEEFPEIVRLLQVYGTEVGRNRISPYYWVSRWAKTVDDLSVKLGDVNIVASDVRFSSEVHAISGTYMGEDCAVIKIIRPGYIHDAEADKHASEQLPELPAEMTYVIQAGTIAELTTALHSTMLELGVERLAAPIAE